MSPMNSNLERPAAPRNGAASRAPAWLPFWW